MFFGKAPGYESLNQVNVHVPEGIPRGDGSRATDISRTVQQ